VPLTDKIFSIFSCIPLLHGFKKRLKEEKAEKSKETSARCKAKKGRL